MSDHLFGAGDYALIVDRRGRRYLVQLEQSATFYSHLGNLPEIVIGQQGKNSPCLEILT